MRLIISMLTAFCLFVNVYAYAGPGDLPNSNVVFDKIGPKKIQLKLLEIPEGRVFVIFKNEYRNVVFKDVIQNGKFTRKNYDLKALANGDYSVEIFSHGHGTLENFKFSLEAEKDKAQYYAKARIIDKENIALLIRSVDKTTKTVKVYHRGYKVFEEDFTGNSFGKVFNFERVSSIDDITFEIKDVNGIGRFVSSVK